MSEDYDDHSALYGYIWEFHPDLLTDFELQAAAAIIGRLKAAESGDSEMAVKHGRMNDPEINAALANGYDEFRRRTCLRVLAGSGGKLTVNRCPGCNRVARTPKAQQCVWCGLDWHE